MASKVSIIGGGLAGVEAAYQAAKFGLQVNLYEMRPSESTDAHESGYLGEMICSNSLGSEEISSPSGLLKEELRQLDSFFLKMADRYRVPAGSSLSVDRMKLAESLTREISAIPNIKLHRQKLDRVPEMDHPVIVATGPLTDEIFAKDLSRYTLRKNLFFFDATSPIIDADSINMEPLFAASRYEKGAADFLNIPLDEAGYNQFVTDLVEADRVEFNDFESSKLFEACLPIEEIARRGIKTLAFGPLKPIGLLNPHTGKMPTAVIQLRQDDLNKNFFQMVGFQTRLKWGEQKRVFRTLPGLEEARFERYGRMHRNSYINAPLILDAFSQCKTHPGLFFAGQISGTEGYVESICSGLLAGIFAAKAASSSPLTTLPPESACGSLLHYISHAYWKDFRPSKFTFGLLPDPPGRFKEKKQKKIRKAEIALESIIQWKNSIAT